MLEHQVLHILNVKITTEQRKRLDMVRTIISLTRGDGKLVTWDHCVQWLLNIVPIEELLKECLGVSPDPTLLEEVSHGNEGISQAGGDDQPAEPVADKRRRKGNAASK